ncbi:hypothetical protein CTAYLR_009225 [Chrysophaeum taylorii]|uniref:Histidine kinase n=1 Tax=Chrysophaeum taylorii TaxID=2483200 RepID=A0AAD7XLB5_9STRA|nr:hypothetical protein CTAYLR_009225 [Chrysophaeum taylorii]
MCRRLAVNDRLPVAPAAAFAYSPATPTNRHLAAIAVVAKIALVVTRRLNAQWAVEAMLVVAAIVCVAVAREAKREQREADAKLDAQHKLARQQAHECRNRLSPAISLMEALMELPENDDAAVIDLKQDAWAALFLAREVEDAHRSSLDCWKIFKGEYEAASDVFDAAAFFLERVEVERAIAKAQAPATTSDESRVEYRLELPETTTSEELYVCADQYVLSHVLSNLLSNARKHCHRGLVTVSLAERDGKLVVSVRDTGVGVPKHIRTRLFDQEITSRHDKRGTGLGLASCRLFCQAADGWIHLRDTRCQDDAGQGGFAVFEFAIAGAIVAGPTAPEDDVPALSPTATAADLDVADENTVLPDDVHVVVIDDSAINRKCLISKLKKICAGTTGWRVDQYETVEAAQSILADLASNPRVLVTFDECLSSSGGVLTGSKGIRWLKQNTDFKGVICSACADIETSIEHLRIGANIAWGKPLPISHRMHADLAAEFQRRAIS